MFDRTVWVHSTGFCGWPARTLINASTRAKISYLERMKHVFPIREAAALLVPLCRQKYTIYYRIYTRQDKLFMRIYMCVDTSARVRFCLVVICRPITAIISQSIRPPLDHATLTSLCKQTLRYNTATMRRRSLGLVALFCSGALSSAFVFSVKPLGGSRQVMEQHHYTVSLIITRQP